MDNFSQSDAAVTYFVAGYIGRCIVKRRKCSACKEILIMSDESPSLQDCLPEEYKSLFEMANRRGLSAPSEYCFTITNLATQYYSTIAADEEKLHQLYALPNQRSAFVTAVTVAVAALPAMHCLSEVKCFADHLNFDLILQTAFNCFSKNLLKRFNSRPAVNAPTAKVLRKVRKLTSKASAK